MKFIKSCFIYGIIIVELIGCVPKKLPEGDVEKIPLSLALTRVLKRYQGVHSLQAQIFAKVEVREEFHLLRGALLYERPAHLHLRLTSALGGTVGEVIYSKDFLSLLVPSEGKIYMGWIGKGDSQGGDTIFLTITYGDYQEMGGERFPTHIYCEIEEKGVRFELRLKEPQVNLPLPEGAFVLTTAGWEICPLEDLKGLFFKPGSGEGS
jgi:hypothetical protein